MPAHQKHPAPNLKDDEIKYYRLPGILPEGHILAFNVRLDLLSYLALNEENPLRVQEQFTYQEMRVLLPLLDNYPDYCPHEVLYASFYGGLTDDRAVERARRRLQEAVEQGSWDYEMRPTRNVLSRVRVKLARFGLGVLSILETGYLLQSAAVVNGHSSK